MSESELDVVFDLCRDRHRRIVLAVLAAERRELTVNDLTKTILKHNHQASVSEVPTKVQERIRISLHHVHLPKLASAGVVEYDRERHRVEPTEDIEQIERHLSSLIDGDPDLEEPIEL